MDAALNCGGDAVIDHLLLKNPDPAVIAALDTTGDEHSPPGEEDLEALGIIETASITAAVEAADRSVKAADIRIISIKTGVQAGGRGITSICGAVGDVELAVEAAAGQAEAKGQLCREVIIPGLHADVKGFLSGNR
jgi:ethanolamine utilization microcompartment shell protein EutS